MGARGAALLIATLTVTTSLVSVHAAERFYNGGAGGTGVRELPLFVAKDSRSSTNTVSMSS